MANSADQDQKPTDLDLHSLQRQGMSGFSRTRVKYVKHQHENIGFGEALLMSMQNLCFLEKQKNLKLCSFEKFPSFHTW